MQLYNYIMTAFYFFRRDMRVFITSIKDDFINYVILYPIIYGISFALLQGRIYFNDGTIGTVLFVGTILVPFMSVVTKVTFDLLFDLAHVRFVDYQMTIVPAYIIIIQRMVFAAFYSFMAMIPFFPVCYFLLGHIIVLNNISWISVICMFVCTSLFMSSYSLFFACYLQPYTIRIFWTRINNTLFTLGGFLIPYATLQQFSPRLAMLNLLNPIVYVTEGLRRAVIGHTAFMSVIICCLVLIGFTVMCTLATLYIFKKRTDHI